MENKRPSFAEINIQDGNDYDLISKTVKWNEENFDDEIASQKLSELTWRITARKRYGLALMILLFLQNFFIGGLIGTAYAQRQLEPLSLTFGILVTGTLGETAFIVRIIITELFKDINYKDYNHKTQ